MINVFYECCSDEQQYADETTELNLPESFATLSLCIMFCDLSGYLGVED